MKGPWLIALSFMVVTMLLYWLAGESERGTEAYKDGWLAGVLFGGGFAMANTIRSRRDS